MPLKRELLEWGCEELSKLGAEEAKASSERLLEAVLDCTRSSLYLNAGEDVSKVQAGKFRRLILKRKARVPVAYLLQKAHFWEEVLEVRPGCLIPRPETEILVDSFIRHSGFRQDRSFSFLDLGSGSGAIGIALLGYFKNARGTFSDISAKALQITRRNLKKYGLTARAKVVRSNLFAGFDPGRTRWDAILSNPPYVAKKDLAGLEPELRLEPAIALDGGKDGFSFYRKIIRQAGRFLVSNGWLVFEAGAGQPRQIVREMSDQGFHQQQIFKDFAGIERVVMAQWNEQHG